MSIQKMKCCKRGHSRKVLRSIYGWHFFIFTSFGLIFFVKWCKWVLFWHAKVSGLKTNSFRPSYLLNPLLMTSFRYHFTCKLKPITSYLCKFAYGDNINNIDMAIVSIPIFDRPYLLSSVPPFLLDPFPPCFVVTQPNMICLSYKFVFSH